MNDENKGLIKLDQATRMLAEIKTVDDAKSIINLAEAARVYAKQVELGLEAQNHAAEIKIRAQRRAGEILSKIESQQGRRSTSNTDVRSPGKVETYRGLDISVPDAERWQKIAGITEEQFEAVIAGGKDEGRELTTALVYKAITQPHVSHNSGENEWYTPEYIIEAARKVLGEIDCDPASSAIANNIVKANQYYTTEDNGLDKTWGKRVWMNPPYSNPLTSEFSEAIAARHESGEVEEACVLVNNATETGWFRRMSLLSSAVCFPMNRIKYLDKNGNIAGSPLQGQAILYFGSNVDRFRTAFEDIGVVWRK